MFVCCCCRSHSCVVVSWARDPLLLLPPRCFSKWCAAVTLHLLGAFVVSMGPSSTAPAAALFHDWRAATARLAHLCFVGSAGFGLSCCRAVPRNSVLQHCASSVLAFGFGHSRLASGQCACLHVSHCHTLHDDIHPLQTATYRESGSYCSRFIRIALPVSSLCV
ncbi:hypothetical protein EV421DRAFT_1254660 [Armillaria borealis]|uniref:Uncharacterized protein n=1 Tax=Armillaria borealis TaxID=47425 RepID=A0AA39J4N3_9AGAR|nr:hypothetical protein EV421DRAFT_1254660 [Armillaria borealis]